MSYRYEVIVNPVTEIHTALRPTKAVPVDSIAFEPILDVQEFVMKYAFVNGVRREAEQGLLGECPNCQQPMISKCGEIKTKHWAHKGKKNCDPWWEKESEWHRDWKAQFPDDWQEVIHFDEKGEKHIADVKTDQDWVIEFQHSFLQPEERKARNQFYKKLVWVVDGTKHEKRFAKAIERGHKLDRFRKINPDFCSLLKQWSGSHAPIFFDFGNSVMHFENSDLWILLPTLPDGMAYVTTCKRIDFLEIFSDSSSQKGIKFEKFLTNWPDIAADHNRRWEKVNWYLEPLRTQMRMKNIKI